MGILNGKVCLITGGGKGMGKAICQLFAEEGGSIVVTARKLSAALEVADNLPGRALALSLDVAKPNEWEASIGAIEKEYGHLDVLVNNAGICEAGSTEGGSEESFRRQIEVNTMGPFYGARAAIPLMRKSGQPGSIINIGTATSVRVIPGFAAYAASKTAMSAMARTLALELATAGDRIRVNTIHPGGTQTEMLEQGIVSTGLPREEALSLFLNIHPMGRLAQPREIARAALWLASDHSSFTTGAEIPVDGASAIRP